MSQENVEVVVDVFENTNARDFAAVMDAYADDLRLELHPDIGLAESTVTGEQAVGEWFGDWFRQFAPDYRFEIEEVRDLGERVFLVATHYGRGRASGVAVTQRLAYLYSLRGGKISRVEAWADMDSALEAAGLPE